MTSTVNHRSEAEKLRAEIAEAKTEIAEAKTKVKSLMGQIRHREGRLRRIAADAFNDVSEPLTGMVAEVRKIVLGLRPCEVSPIGICVFSNRVISIPGQQGRVTARLDACLFCGKQGKPEDVGVTKSIEAR